MSESPALKTLLDLRRRDRYGDGVGVDVGYASANDAATEEADDPDDVAHLGRMLGPVLVEAVDRVGWVARGKRDAEGLDRRHDRTMACR